ncbi:MAG TPA: transposase [Thermoguttaceae bacterium]|nr:transposase [Thermoguttaceae bacterium]
MKKPRRRFGTDQKATILKRYLVDQVPISDLCDEYGIKPNQIYAWQKILFDHAETAFQKAAGRLPPAYPRRRVSGTLLDVSRNGCRIARDRAPG